MLVHISEGNSKLGEIANVSLVPVKDCGNCEACKEHCYGLKGFRQYPNVKAAWSDNSVIARSNLTEYFKQIRSYIEANKVNFFRWHVAGDILSQAYLNKMITLANKLPDTRFLCFTKMHKLNYQLLPSNLTVVFSMWPGMEYHDRLMPTAWMQDGTETRVPADALHCPGNCESCGMCWQLPSLGRDVVFNKH